MEKKVSSTLVGVAGEYFVAAELSRLGYIASITLRNTKGIDIIATNEEGTKTVNIQVKTKRPGLKEWMMSEKNESTKDKNIYYVFVSLNEGMTRPDYHISSSSDVARFIKRNHKRWLETPGKSGQKHNENKMRKWFDEKNKYKERWDLLGLDN